MKTNPDDLSERIARLSPEQRALLNQHLLERASGAPARPAIPRRARSGPCPPSFAQERLWFLEQLEPGRGLYNGALAWQLRGPLDSGALERSLGEIVRRHEALRTTFADVEGRPLQVIAPDLKMSLPLVDLGQLPASERAARAQALATEAARRPFDLAAGPLIRAALFRLAADEHLLVLSLHHIVTDGWSSGLLRRELATLYAADLAGQPSPLAELPIQYADFAVWQRDWLSGDVLEEQLAYWRRQLAGAPPLLELPTDHPRPAVQSYRGGRLGFALPATLAAELKTLGRREGATLFMTLLGAFQALLGRYSGQDDVLVGSPIAGRNRTELEGLIGFFVNTLVLRADLSEDPTFRELLGRVRETCLGAYAHQDLPFEKLVEALQPARDLSRGPLVQVLFVLQNTNPPSQRLELPDLELSPLEVEGGVARFDLALSMTETEPGLRGALLYATDLFEAATIERLAGHLRALLEGVVADPDRRLSELPILTEPERRQLLVEWNATRAHPPARTGDDHPPAMTIHALFEAQVERTPDAVALVFENRPLSYRELNRRANQLAHRLRKLGVGPERPVGIAVERSPELLVGLLGILKAGGAYLPLDPRHPRERLAFTLEDARAPVLLTQQRLLGALPERELAAVCLDADWETIAQEAADNPAGGARPDNLAYVIYTSGSTGRPKGVCVSHGVATAHLATIGQAYGMRSDDRVFQLASASFDASIEQILLALLVGAAVVLPREAVVAPADLLRAVRSAGLTVIWFPPPYWHQVLQAAVVEPRLASPHALRLIIAGGDTLLPETVRLWQQTPLRSVRLLNVYGPTEATISATLFEVSPERGPDPAWRSLPIGRPLADRTAYVLDQHGNPVPLGLPGELHLGGAGLARGYLDRPELTAEKFISDPFSSEPGARLYKTGDLACYLPDGNLQFLGRLDQQVKLRGIRIEPGDEIEAALRQHPGVCEAAVLARQDAPGDQRLVAYVVADRDVAPTPAELRGLLGQTLPEYMLPAVFVPLPSLPLGPSGKLDRGALPAPGPSRPALAEAFVAPRTPVERRLAEIWAGVLRVERVGALDNFFDLGGHSLLATQVIARTREAFRLELPLRSLFEAPTVAGLAVAIVQRWAERSGDDQLGQLLARLEAGPAKQ